MTGNAFSPGTIEAKVGDVITWTNGDGVPHTATYKDDPTCTTERSARVSRRLYLQCAGTYAFFCQIHTGHDRDHRGHELGQSARSARNNGRSGRQVDRRRRGQPGVGEPGQEAFARGERRALVQLVQLDAGDDLAVPGRELAPSRWERPVEHDQPPAGSQRRPRGTQDLRGITQLVERVLEISEVVFADLALDRWPWLRG